MRRNGDAAAAEAGEDALLRAPELTQEPRQFAQTLGRLPRDRERRALEKNIDDSLRRLRTDYVNVLQLQLSRAGSAPWRSDRGSREYDFLEGPASFATALRFTLLCRVCTRHRRHRKSRAMAGECGGRGSGPARFDRVPCDSKPVEVGRRCELGGTA